MKSSYFAIRLFLKTERLRKDGTAIIYARIRLNREKIELTTNKRVHPKQWDTKHEKVKNHPESDTLNKYLLSFKAQIDNAYSQLFIAKKDITLEGIKALLAGEAAEKQHGLIEIAEEHNAHFEKMVGIKYSYGSYKNYKTTLKYLKEFVPEYSSKGDIPLMQVNYKFCEAYFTFLTTVKQCHTNGANKQIQRLKKIINYAIKHGYILNNPMATYTLEFDPVNKVALTLAEVNRLSALKLHRQVLEEVRDVFLMQCYTGLSYADIKRLAPQHLSIAENGVYWIHMERQKTKISFSIPILAQALVILQKYMPQTTTDRPIFPVLCNQRMNSNLKLVQELCAISKNLTTHLARHTFATTITLSHGVPIETVSRMLGHTKLSTTQLYAKVLDSKIDKDMHQLSEKLQLKEGKKNSNS